MIAFKGRLSFKQYMPLKPTKRGIKVWARADSVSSYMNAFQVYTGKEGGRTAMGLGERVVVQLSKPLFGKYHHCFCDNFFRCSDIWRQTECMQMGTCHSSRKLFPLDIRKPKLQQGELVFRQDGNPVATSWQDKKPVAFLSTFSPPEEPDLTVQRRQKDGSLIDIPAPPIVASYNDFMGGVDRAGQLRKSYMQ